MPEFKVGDKVIRTWLSRPDVPVGSVHTVSAVCRTLGITLEGLTAWYDPDYFELYVELKPFTKADLKDGYHVWYRAPVRDSDKPRIVIGRRFYVKEGADMKKCMDIDHLNDDLTDKDPVNRYDVVKVTYMGEVLFEREEPKPIVEVTLDDVAKKLGIDVKQLRIKE